MAIEENEVAILTGELLADAGEIHLDAAMALDLDAKPDEAIEDVIGFWEALTNAADVLNVPVTEGLIRKTQSELESLAFALESQDLPLIGRMLRDDLLELVSEWKTALGAIVPLQTLDAGNGVTGRGDEL